MSIADITQARPEEEGQMVVGSPGYGSTMVMTSDERNTKRAISVVASLSCDLQVESEHANESGIRVTFCPPLSSEDLSWFGSFILGLAGGFLQGFSSPQIFCSSGPCFSSGLLKDFGDTGYASAMSMLAGMNLGLDGEQGDVELFNGVEASFCTPLSSYSPMVLRNFGSSSFEYSDYWCKERRKSIGCWGSRVWVLSCSFLQF